MTVCKNCTKQIEYDGKRWRHMPWPGYPAGGGTIYCHFVAEPA